MIRQHRLAPGRSSRRPGEQRSRTARGLGAALTPSRLIGLLQGGLFGLVGLLGIVAIVGPLPAEAQNDVQVLAELGPKVASVDDYVFFSIQIERRGQKTISLRPTFVPENLEIVGQPARQESVGIGFGGQRRSLTLVWRLRPLAPGPARVHSIRLQFVGEGGVVEQVFEIPEKRIDVVEALDAPSAPDRANGRQQRQSRSPLDPWMRRMMPNFPPIGGRPNRPGQVDPSGRTRTADLFLKTFVSTDHPYVGQRVDFLAYLYTRLPIRDIQLRRIPDFAGLWVRDIGPPPAGVKEERVAVGGEIYSRFLLFHRHLFALRPGAYDLEPVTARIEAGGVLDPFGSSFGIPAVSDHSSDEIRLEIAAVPTPSPADFEGIVGKVSLSARLLPDTIDLDGAATIELVLAGDGYLESVEAPRPPTVDGLRIFAPRQGSAGPLTSSRGGDSKGAQRRWTYVVTVDSTTAPGSLDDGHTFLIPPFELSYFDPVQGSYRVTSASLPLLALRPRPPSASAAGDAAELSDDADQNAKAGLQRDGERGGLWGRTLGRLRTLGSSARKPALAIAGLLLLGAAGLVVKRLTRVRSSNLSRRGKPLTDAQQSQLEILDLGFREAATLDRPRRAASRCEAAWREFLGTAFELPTGESTMTWTQSLADLGVPAEVRQGLQERLDEVRALRHAPELADTAALIADLGRRAHFTGIRLLD